jgi:hypothetical protein
MGNQTSIYLLLIAGATILICLLYELTSHLKIRPIGRAVITFGLAILASIAGWALFSSGSFVSVRSWINLSDPTVWQGCFIGLWLLLGWLFSKAAAESMHQTLRLLLGLILSFAVTHYFMEMLHLVYFP